jgi:hypothetical protein
MPWFNRVKPSLPELTHGKVTNMNEQVKRFTGRGANLKTGITERHQKVAHDILVEGKSITRAMADNGFSEKSAKQGMARIRRSKPLALAYGQEVERLKNQPVPPAAIRAQIVRAKLLQNVAENRDNAVQSLKLLAQDREVDMLRPESAAGVIVIGELPKGLAHLMADLPALPAIEAPLGNPILNLPVLDGLEENEDN